MGFSKAYKGFSGRAQCWLAVSFVAGLCLLGLGFWGDLAPPSWWPRGWHEYGYVSNILASFTSFLIGVPVALVVVEAIRSNYAQNVQIDSVNRISRTAWSDFADAVHILCADRRIKALQYTEDHSSATQQVKAEHDLIMRTIKTCRDAIQRDPSSSIAQIAKLRSVIAEHEPVLHKKYDAISQALGSESALGRQWSLARALWEVIDTHVRLRRLEFDLDNMDLAIYSSIRDRMTPSENPIFEFFKVHKRVAGTERPIVSIRGLLKVLDQFANRSDSQVANIIVKQYSEYFGAGGVTDYSIKASRAYNFLVSLKDGIDAVTESGWPANATKPKR